MSYTYLQEQGEEYSVECYSDIPAFVLSKLMNTVEKSCCKGSGTESSRGFQSKMTSGTSTANRGEEKSRYWQEDFLAKTFLPKEQTMGQNLALMENARAFGWSICDLLKKSNLSISLPKILRSYELGDLEQSSKGFPLWGIMHGGVVSEVLQSVRITRERDSGYLPTVLATDWKGGTTAIRKDTGKQRIDQWRDYVKVKYSLTYPHPTHSELRMGWPEGWTDLKPLEMGKYRKWLRSHGQF